MNESTYISIAVKNLQPDAEFTFSDNDLTTLKSLNGVKLPIINAIEKELKQVKANEIVKAEAKIAAKEAAQAKLAALGLTVEDLQALGL